MTDINLCGMVAPEITDPERYSLGSDDITGGCLGPNRQGFEIEACKKCQFYPKLEVIKVKIDKI